MNQPIIPNYRACGGIHPPPSGPPPVQPVPPNIPTIPTMCMHIGKWTYFWLKDGVSGWGYVKLTGIHIDPNNNQQIPAVWGCNSIGEHFAIPLSIIDNFTT